MLAAMRRTIGATLAAHSGLSNMGMRGRHDSTSVGSVAAVAVGPGTANGEPRYWSASHRRVSDDHHVIADPT